MIVMEVLFFRAKESIELIYNLCLLHFEVNPHNRMVLFY